MKISEYRVLRSASVLKYEGKQEIGCNGKKGRFMMIISLQIMLSFSD